MTFYKELQIIPNIREIKGVQFSVLSPKKLKGDP